MRDPRRARSDGLITEDADDEVVVYDEVSHLVHSLSAEVASIWRLCDGVLSVDQMALALDVGPAAIERALDELGECGLLDAGLEPGPSYSRRQAAKKFTQLAGGVFGASLIYSVEIPTAAAAASSSCVANQSPESTCTASVGKKTADAKCCSGTCYNGSTVGKICVPSGCTPAGLGCVLSGAGCCSLGCFALFCT